MSNLFNTFLGVFGFAGILAAIVATIYTIKTYHELRREGQRLHKLKTMTSGAINSSTNTHMQDRSNCSGNRPGDEQVRDLQDRNRYILDYLMYSERLYRNLRYLLLIIIFLSAFVYFVYPFDALSDGGILIEAAKAVGVTLILGLLYSMVESRIFTYNFGFVFLGNLPETELVKFIEYFKQCRWTYNTPKKYVEMFLRKLSVTKKYFD